MANKCNRSQFKSRKREPVNLRKLLNTLESPH
jgi:hypothetical protein